MAYAGLFNSSYVPSPVEKLLINTPNDQLGPTEAGQLIVSLLQGVMLVQYGQYVQAFWHEKRWTKWLVHLAFALCLLKFGYVWAISWDTLVSHYGDWAYLTTFHKISIPLGLSTTIPSAVCQAFFIHRCWVLSRNWVFMLPACGTFLIMLGSAGVLTYGSAVIAGGDNTVSKLILTSVNVSLASALACDIFITTFTCYYLIQERTGFKETDTLVKRLVKCSIESAVGPTLVALVNLILSNKSNGNQWFILPNLALSHVYGVSLLYSVNARKAPATGSQLSADSKGPVRYNEFPLQELHGRSDGVLVGVQTVVRKDPSTPEVRAFGRAVSDSEFDQKSSPISLTSRDKGQFFV